MQLATSTNLLFGRPDGSHVPLEVAMARMAKAGFRVLDMNFYDWAEPGDVFLTPEWRGWIEGIAQAAEDNHIRFGQTHAYFYDFLDPALSQEQRDWLETISLRSVEASYLLGARLTVTHPQTDFAAPRLVQRSREQNREYFNRFLEKTAKWDMNIALENMWDRDITPRRKYGVTAEELVELVDDIGSRRLGICWDFEHGDIMQQDQAREILCIGKRLYALHASEQHGCQNSDYMHILPMLGRMNWGEIVHALGQIDYQGYFTFEAHNFLNTLPDSAVDTALKLAYEVGQYLVGLE